MPPATAAPAGWPGRAGRWLALAALVLWAHALLLQGLTPTAARQGGGPRAATIELRRLPPPATPERRPAAERPVQAPGVAPADARRQALAPSTAPAAADLPEAAADTDPPAETGAGATPRDLSATEPGASSPPPVYATRLPDPAQLRYALHYNGQASEVLLQWWHDGQRYSLALDGLGVPRGRPLLAQASQGAVDAHGLAPERFVDRRPRGRQQAANFRRDTGRIGFSGPSVELPAWPGAQDRLSWLVQLAAILAAGHDGPELQMLVVDARGAGSLWQLQRQPDEVLDTPWGSTALQLWQREPPRPEGLRVQAWLDASRGHWPVLLRFTAPRSGSVFELRLLAPPDAPTPP